MRHSPSEFAARQAAEYLRIGFFDRKKGPVVDTALVLGTGWGDALVPSNAVRIPFQKIPGLEALAPLAGHAREVVYGTIGRKPVIILNGRVHLNERPADPSIHKMVRLQIEMLLQLGVKNLILTCAAGSLSPSVNVGSVIAVDGFMTLFAPDMPLYAGEFCSPEDTLDADFRALAHNVWKEQTGQYMPINSCGYAMVRGPFFEGRRFDKEALYKTGANMVGMSMLPEACIAALYPDTKVLGLAFITNSAHETHSHEENMKRVKRVSKTLGGFLKSLVREMHSSKDVVKK